MPSLGGGGAERTVIQLANSFAEKGLKIHLGVCDLNGDKAKLLPEVSSKIELVNFNCGRVMNSITPLKLKMKAEQYDCLWQRKPIPILWQALRKSLQVLQRD